MHKSLDLHDWQEVTNCAVDLLNTILFFEGESKAECVFVSPVLHEPTCYKTINLICPVNQRINSCNATKVWNLHSILDIPDEPARSIRKLIYQNFIVPKNKNCIFQVFSFKYFITILFLLVITLLRD